MKSPTLNRMSITTVFPTGKCALNVTCSPHFYENNDLLIGKHMKEIFLSNFMGYVISRCVGCVTWRQLGSYLRKIPSPFQIMVSHPLPLSWDVNIYTVYLVLVAVKYSVAFIGPQYFQTFSSRMEIKVDFRH